MFTQWSQFPTPAVQLSDVYSSIVRRRSNVGEGTDQVVALTNRLLEHFAIVNVKLTAAITNAAHFLQHARSDSYSGAPRTYSGSNHLLGQAKLIPPTRSFINQNQPLNPSKNVSPRFPTQARETLVINPPIAL